ncbi:hypothetical protein LP089_07385 [Moraxella bovis]|uniref:DUF3168 domain-containing protein n=1 Tax=Moraxella bovis TaxID=476 RepID=A0ABY6MBY9_MORBO|nr:hypothetical protein [Moraxella bovis]UYZ69967.1 hypothetical protein LP089_07385 [Moraxella bovis]UZA04530.1 hypothetical protein LP092_07345 [Moraxella bovis]UZA28405.1 hypothetical protein LP119_05470 [Moraxella bovis]UZA39149.1 hypothetical protein LP101_06310 [Moraxella bovis]
MDNYFGVGLALTDLLKTLQHQGEPLFRRVDFLQSLNDVSEQRQITPACYVVYRGDTVSDTAGRGERVKVSQRYSVIIAISHSASQINAYDSVQVAGEIIPFVLRQLQGVQVVPYASPLKRVGSDVAGFSNAFSYYPFTFSTDITI